MAFSKKTSFSCGNLAYFEGRLVIFEGELVFFRGRSGVYRLFPPFLHPDGIAGICFLSVRKAKFKGKTEFF